MRSMPETSTDENSRRKTTVRIASAIASSVEFIRAAIVRNIFSASIWARSGELFGLRARSAMTARTAGLVSTSLRTRERERRVGPCTTFSSR